ncbi:hypothetical protein Q8791_22600 [Nocardiopsis sp. CT-R113]|uniref:Uncharacterized protein n=1 Tax=Nocardiopsis codii TaxID=3065942 RepID=A0ABU7KCP9_9ACTN|nr:hypothetical protein [Nocardiopsis sp. CT-R113]MEE2040011.1 hypothetical protein [Nocardiopsis sp. CT-R113]
MVTRHEHLWSTDSDHPTSEGVVSYQRCGCGERRVTLTPSVRLVQARPAPSGGRSAG